MFRIDQTMTWKLAVGLKPQAQNPEENLLSETTGLTVTADPDQFGQTSSLQELQRPLVFRSHAAGAEMKALPMLT